MNRRSVYLLAGISFWAACASAETSYEYAPVLESRPVYQLIAIEKPVEQCWEEEVAVERYAAYEGSNTPVLLSTVIGAQSATRSVMAKATSGSVRWLGRCWGTRWDVI